MGSGHKPVSSEMRWSFVTVLRGRGWHLVKKEETTEGGKAGWASKIEPGPLLSSKSGSAVLFSDDFKRQVSRHSNFSQSKILLYQKDILQ